MRSRNVSPGIRSDTNSHLIGKHSRAARHGAPVASRFADNRGALPGYDRFINGGDAFDYFAIARNQIACLGDNDVTRTQLGRGYGFNLFIHDPFGHSIRFSLPQSVRLGLAAGFCHGFRKVGEKHRKPEPQRYLKIEAFAWSTGENIANQKNSNQGCTNLHHKDDRVLQQRKRIQLNKGITRGAPDDLWIE